MNTSPKKKFTIDIWKILTFACAGVAVLFAVLYATLPRELPPREININWTDATAQQATGGSLKGRKIIVDAGHGGMDPGSTGTGTGRLEKEINLEIAIKLRNTLEGEGAQVIMTRMTDDAIGATKEEDMLERERIIKTAKADMFISVHQNLFEKPEARGPQVFFVEEGSVGKRLAVSIQEMMNDRLQIAQPRMALPVAYRLLKPGAQPSCTVECGFISNPDEEKLLQDPQYQQKLVNAVTDGVKLYVARFLENPDANAQGTDGAQNAEGTQGAQNTENPPATEGATQTPSAKSSSQ